jgi:hypothetical protein
MGRLLRPVARRQTGLDTTSVRDLYPRLYRPIGAGRLTMKPIASTIAVFLMTLSLLWSCTPQQIQTVRDARQTAVGACESQVLQWAVVQAAARDQQRAALDVASELCLLLKSQCLADAIESAAQRKPVATPEAPPPAPPPEIVDPFEKRE